MFEEWVQQILTIQNDMIEDALCAGLIEGCGIRIERARFDATAFSVKPDKDVPLGEIHEHIID
jgi:hypothetical protein